MSAIAPEPSPPDTERVPLLRIRRQDEAGRHRKPDIKERLAWQKQMQDNARAPTSSYSLWVAICFVLNYSIGSGVLGLPIEFFHSGWLLGSILLLWSGILAYCTYRYVSNCCIRAEALDSIILAYSNDNPINNNNPTQNENNNNNNNDGRRERILNPIITSEYLVSGKNPIFIATELKKLRLTTLEMQGFYNFERNKHQLNELISIFCGKKVRIFYEICYYMTQFTALWSFMALFGASLASNIGITGISDSCNIEHLENSLDNGQSSCLRLYSVYVSVFWVWSVFITMFEFEKQKGLQIVSAMARILIIVLMTATSIGLIYSDYEYNGHAFVYTNASKPHYGHDINAWNWGGLLYFVAVGGFAFGNQFCVADVVRPLKQQDRPNQRRLWGNSMAILCGVYLLAGITVSLAFGQSVESPCTLAWSKFTGFWFSENSDGIRPLWSAIIGWFIVLLPAIDIASSYPLNAITTSNTITQSFLNKDERNDYYWHLIIRFVLCTSTAIFALLVWNFDFVIILSGGLGMIALYVIPSYMEYKSRKFINSIVIGNDEMASNVNAYINSSNNVNDGNINKKEWIDNKFWYFAASITSIIAFIGVICDIIWEAQRSKG